MLDGTLRWARSDFPVLILAQIKSRESNESKNWPKKREVVQPAPCLYTTERCGSQCAMVYFVKALLSQSPALRTLHRILPSSSSLSARDNELDSLQGARRRHHISVYQEGLIRRCLSGLDNRYVIYVSSYFSLSALRWSYWDRAQ
jgi:hypothetical protein